MKHLILILVGSLLIGCQTTDTAVVSAAKLVDVYEPKKETLKQEKTEGPTVAKLSIKLPSNMGIVPYDEDGTMLYVVTKPSKQEIGIFLSMQGSAGCLFYSRAPVIKDEESLISKGGPSKTHPSIMIRSTSNWTNYGLKVIQPNCPDTSFDSSDSTYTDAISEILVRENPNNLPVFVSGMSRGSIRAVNIASRLG